MACPTATANITSVFNKSELLQVVHALAWPETTTHTTENRYRTSPVLSCCVVLCRLSNPCRWWDLELFFWKHAPQLSEIFWESIELFIAARGHLLTGTVNEGFVQARAASHASSIYGKCEALSNCIGFLDGTVIGIARPSRSMWQRVAYNGHKRKHALKFQSLMAPDGLILNAFGPVEGHRHDWTLYLRRGLEERLPLILNVNCMQYCIYTDSGYNERWFMRVTFQGSNLTQAQKAFNKVMSAVRVTFEWAFKDIKVYWPVIDYKRKLRVSESPVGLMYLTAMLLHNIRSCLYPSTVAQYFNCAPPTLGEYLSMGE